MIKELAAEGVDLLALQEVWPGALIGLTGEDGFAHTFMRPSPSGEPPKASAIRLTDSHGIPAEEAADVPITGTPTQAAERFAAYAGAGATWLVLTTIGDDWHAQWELIAEAATLLD
jgi:hypothetical protein